MIRDAAPKTAEVVVIGGGIVGCATAFRLARAGMRPIIVERATGLATATTAASAHAIRAQFVEPENVTMMRESIEIYERFSEVLDLPPSEAGIGLTQQGYLFASTAAAALETFAARVRLQHPLGLTDVELLDGDEVRRRFPWVSPAVTAAAFRARDGWLDGCRAAELYARAAQVPLLLDTAVAAIELAADRVVGVRTARGPIATKSVVLATGPFAGELSPAPLPIILIRRNRLIVAPDQRIPAEAPMTIDADTGAHWRPHRGGALAAWGRPEPATAAVWPVPPDPTFPDRVLNDPDGIARLCPFWGDVAPTLSPEALSLTAGQYTMTPDHAPLIGPATETRGLWLHTGYSGHGIMGSASGARLLADLMTGAVPDHANPFRPGRFAAGVPVGESMIL